MSEVTIRPRVRCDNCGVTAEKEHRLGKWKSPITWGSCSVSPNSYERYPNNIGMTDLCEKCLRLVHHAVGEALIAGRRALEDEQS